MMEARDGSGDDRGGPGEAVPRDGGDRRTERTQLAALQVGNDSAGYRDMIRLARRWPDRIWAVEGAGGVGVQLAQRLVADGETVLDVPPKLSTRARIFDVGHGRKSDPGDARTVAVVAIRTQGLRQVVPDDEMVALRLMSERRRELVRSRTADGESAAPAADGADSRRRGTESDRQARPRHCWRRCAPVTSPAKTRRQLAADLLDDLVGLDRKLKELDKRLKAAVDATGTSLTDINGVGTATAAMILAEVGDVRRFPTRHHFASYTGTAPIDVSSGEDNRHRLYRAGNRRLNHALHIIALCHKRYDSRGGDYYARSSPPARARRAPCAA